MHLRLSPVRGGDHTIECRQSEREEIGSLTGSLRRHQPTLYTLNSYILDFLNINIV